MTAAVSSAREGAVGVVARLAGVLDVLTTSGDWDRAAAVECDIAELLPAALAQVAGGDRRGGHGDAVAREAALTALGEVAEIYRHATARLCAARDEIQKERDRLHRGRREAGAYLDVALGS